MSIEVINKIDAIPQETPVIEVSMANPIYQGPIGPKGEKGDQGETGAQGPKGDTGAQGPMGPQGPKGDKGETGPKGEDGNITFEELTDEQKELLRGPQGIPGPTGPAGEKGAQGETGPQGPQGPQGIQGIQGEVGPEGPAGEKGDKGDPGEKGEAGPAGDSGVYVGSEAPTNDANIWIDPNGTPIDIGGGGGQDSFFLDFSNATTTPQPATEEMIKFAEYFAEHNGQASLYIRDTDPNSGNYYYPALMQSSDPTSQIAMMRASINLNSVKTNNPVVWDTLMLNKNYSTKEWQYTLLASQSFTFASANEKDTTGPQIIILNHNSSPLSDEDKANLNNIWAYFIEHKKIPSDLILGYKRNEGSSYYTSSWNYIFTTIEGYNYSNNNPNNKDGYLKCRYITTENKVESVIYQFSKDGLYQYWYKETSDSDEEVGWHWVERNDYYIDLNQLNSNTKHLKIVGYWNNDSSYRATYEISSQGDTSLTYENGGTHYYVAEPYYDPNDIVNTTEKIRFYWYNDGTGWLDFRNSYNDSRMTDYGFWIMGYYEYY